jgi:hypothetical protein
MPRQNCQMIQGQTTLQVHGNRYCQRRNASASAECCTSLSASLLAGWTAVLPCGPTQQAPPACWLLAGRQVTSNAEPRAAMPSVADAPAERLGGITLGIHQQQQQPRSSACRCVCCITRIYEKQQPLVLWVCKGKVCSAAAALPTATEATASCLQTCQQA